MLDWIVMERLKELLIFVVAMIFSVILFGVSQNRVEAQTSCDIDCLNGKITALTKRVAALEKSLAARGASGVRPAAARTTTQYFQISGGSATSNNWVDVPGTTFYFDQSLYGNVVSVTWEGWMENGNGQARLYDKTNNRAVDGSEISVSAAGRASFYSNPMAIWRGQNQYTIQVQNVNLQQVTITTPRLRIVTK